MGKTMTKMSTFSPVASILITQFDYYFVTSPVMCRRSNMSSGTDPAACIS